MQGCLWRCIGVAASFVILGFFLQEKEATYVEHKTSLDEKMKIIQQIVHEKISSEMNDHLKYFTEMQKDPPALLHANYTLLAGDSFQAKRLLTVGISSERHTNETHLLDTLKSLFLASSERDLEYMLVLVLLSDTDPKWLHQTVASILLSFTPYIESGRLLVVHGLLGSSLARRKHTSPCGKLYSRQKTSSVLLMNFARNFSDYFLMLGDNVKCAPRFLSDIYWAVLGWKQLPWVTLDFSNMKTSGKVFHTRDLPRLISYLLLCPKDIPTHLLLSEFSLLLSQNVPIHFSPSIFYHMGSYSELEDTCFPGEQNEDLGEPDNPVATVFTDMFGIWLSVPRSAYILNDDCFWALNPIEGNYLLVVLDKPQKVIRVAVVTGSKETMLNFLQHGQLLVGYSLMDYPKHCAHYTLVGPLVRGQLDQMVFYEEDSVKEISCIKLLVTASHDYPIKIVQIRVWTEVEEEES